MSRTLRGPGTMPDGEGVQKTIQEKVERHFSDRSAEAISAAPESNGLQAPFAITEQASDIQTHISSHDGLSGC